MSLGLWLLLILPCQDGWVVVMLVLVLGVLLMKVQTQRHKQ